MWVVYILKCRNGILYTGVTNNLPNRVVQHNAGKGAKFTAINKPCILVWHEHHANRSAAQKKEWEIKEWDRKEKLEFIKRNSSQCRECPEQM